MGQDEDAARRPIIEDVSDDELVDLEGETRKVIALFHEISRSNDRADASTHPTFKHS